MAYEAVNAILYVRHGRDFLCKGRRAYLSVIEGLATVSPTSLLVRVIALVKILCPVDSRNSQSYIFDQ